MRQVYTHKKAEENDVMRKFSPVKKCIHAVRPWKKAAFPESTKLFAS